MRYRSDKFRNQLSVLGLGCMCFPARGRIDLAETERELEGAVYRVVGKLVGRIARF